MLIPKCIWKDKRLPSAWLRFENFIEKIIHLIFVVRHLLCYTENEWAICIKSELDPDLGSFNTTNLYMTFSQDGTVHTYIMFGQIFERIQIPNPAFQSKISN